MKLIYKIIFTKALLFWVMPFVFAGQVDINNKPLHGKVKSIFEKEFSAHFDIVGDVYRVGKNNLCKYYYDSLGNMIRYEFLQYNESIAWYWIQSYNELNQPTEKISYQGDNVFASHQRFFYDNQKLTYWLLYDQYKKFSYGWYLTYDKKGNLIQINARNSDSLVSITYNYLYKKSGKFLAVTETTKIGDNTSSSKKVYNKNNQLVSQVTEGNNTFSTCKFHYDIKGNLVQKDEHVHVGDIISQLLETKHWYYKYDNMNNETEFTMTLNDSLIRKVNTIYTFDSLSNWTSKTILINDVPDKVVDRIISYY